MTVKPNQLMSYLVKLVTPKNGTVMDPFMGSGSTLKAAISCGFNCIGIQRQKQYFEIAKQRCQFQIKRADWKKEIKTEKVDLTNIKTKEEREIIE